jgi:hypothetical protein
MEHGSLQTPKIKRLLGQFVALSIIIRCPKKEKNQEDMT